MWRYGKKLEGRTVFIIASGPSSSQADADLVKGRTTMTVNSSWRLAPWADIHYSSDHDWWDLNIEAMREQCGGEFWTGHPSYQQPGVNRCPYDKRGRGLSKAPGVINWGGNSGYCAIGLAYQFGAAGVVLLGYDQSDKDGSHWHGDHPAQIAKGFNWPMWRERFGEMAKDARTLGFPILNATRKTTLDCFPRVKLEEVLLCCK